MSNPKEYWDVQTCKKYITDQGEEKVVWFTAGNIKVLPNGKKFLTLYQQPDTDFFVFEQREEVLPVIQ